MLAALIDLWLGLSSVTVWSTLGWNDIRQRYRRSFIGPFWLTLSTLVMIAIVGPLYGRLLGQNLQDYYPYLAVGLMLWGLISGMVIENCSAFILAEAYIKELPLPMSLYVIRVVWRNLLIFAHSLVVLVPLLFLLGVGSNFFTFLWVPGVVAVALNGICLGITLATLCTRFRDIPQIIQNLVQVGFFATPIMWKRESLGNYGWITSLNPLSHFVDIVREPMLGMPFPTNSWGIVLLISVINFAFAVLFLGRFRQRIAYWL
jgi:lipopolysaccharide transport system permease protein